LEKNIIYLVQQMLKENRISFDSKEFAFQIESHPTFPSLHSITGVLEHFSIDNLALDVALDGGVLLQLPLCFLVQVEIDSVKSFAIVIRNKSDYTLVKSAKEKRRITSSELSSIHTGIVVAVEKTTNQIVLRKKTSVGEKTILMFFVIALFSLLFSGVFTVFSTLYLVISVSGLFVSLAIIKQELGLQTSIGDAFCSATNEKKDCNSVLSSNGATLFKTIKLSDLSITYFSAFSILSFLFIVDGNSFSILHGISVIVCPIIIYTLLYQKFKVKQWCALCLLVSMLILGQAVLGIIQYPLFFNEKFSLNTILITSVIFSGVLLVVKVIKGIVKELKALKQDKLEAFKFKRNFNLFKELLQKSSIINTELLETSEIVLGNKKAPLQITIITNPFCGHCKPVHELIESILYSYHKDVAITIRFSVATNDLESYSVQVTSRLLELYETEGAEKCLLAMNDVYGNVTADSWLKKWGKCNNVVGYVQVLNKESNWCTANGINFTPEMLVNGRPFPTEYNRKDLIYFIKDLAEEAQKKDPILVYSMDNTSYRQ